METKAYTINTTEQEISTNYINRFDQPIGFLMEGCATGKADLVFIVKQNNAEICRSSVHLDLREITDFYDVYHTGKIITRRFGHLWETNPKWDVQVDTNAVQVQTNTAYTADATKYLLLVHGWNMSDQDKLDFAQTAFKRLWWQKYKGGFGLYDWPTLTTPGFWGTTFAPGEAVHNYEDSEMIAWLSSTALAKVMESLNGSGHLRVWAHSMGNVVVGEAVKKYNGAQHVQTYIASQAAIPGSIYSKTASNTTISATTPNIYAYWSSGNTNASDNPYLNGNSAKINQMCNYYNAEDKALDWWEVNNWMKPDGAPGYGFAYGGSPDIYDETTDVTNRFYRGWEGLEITNGVPDLRERYEVFSYCAESRARALGQANNPAFSVNRNLQGPPLGYDNQRYSHSRQFRSNVVDEKGYYEHLITDGGF